MKKRIFFILLCFMVFVGLVSCGSKDTFNNENSNNNENDLVDLDIKNSEEKVKQGYIEGTILVKYDGCFNESLVESIDYVEVAPLYKGSKWYKISLNQNQDTLNAYKKLNDLNLFDRVELDYQMKTSEVDISSNPYAESMTFVDSHGISNGWDFMSQKNKTPGGSRDVIIAVIDTGVDYNHIDLRNNIWTNNGEIPNNGIDDDDNGYVDDYYGWNFEGNDNDPMDNNGHGTHVAGIISSENNSIGTVGIAYNCRIMCLKAGAVDGTFKESDIAEAVMYAYMNGASVINMSFGGYGGCSSALTDAFIEAYNQCVLVAAAGNETKCVNSNHSPMHASNASYPAALPYVIGVMSCNYNGMYASGFTNFDDDGYNNLEYNVYACGENIVSTYPHNRYVKMSGTSMATPIVAGMAALLRSYYDDRDAYATKFIYSQIVNTGELNPIVTDSTGTSFIDQYHTVINPYNAMFKSPTPNVEFDSFEIFDNVDFSEKNNGDGTVDAGETIHVGINLFNLGGVAKNIKLKLSTKSQAGISDKYITIVEDEIETNNVGTYSVGTGGRVYDNEKVIDYENYFTVIISDDCPNARNIYFFLTIEYEDGLDDNNTKTYLKKYDINPAFSFEVNNGTVLPTIIDSDLVLHKGVNYIIKDFTRIEKEATVTFEAGTMLTFNADVAANTGMDMLYSYGTIIMNGTKDEPITINKTCEGSVGFSAYGSIEISYVNSYVSFQHCNNNYDDTVHNISNSNFYESVSLVSTNMINCYAKYCTILKSGKVPFDIESNCFGTLRIGSPSYSTSVGYGNKLLIDSNLIDSLEIYYLSSLTDETSFSFTNNVIKYSFCVNGSKQFPLDCFEGNLYLYDTFRKGGSKYNNDNFISTSGEYKVRLWNKEGEGDYENVPYFVEDFWIEDEDGNVIKKIGNGTVKFVVIFNRDVPTDFDFNILFGSRTPYSDYTVTGSFVTPRKWEGEYTLKATIESGVQTMLFHSSDFIINKCVYVDAYNGSRINNIEQLLFEIDLTNAMSMTLQANPTISGVDLTWVQDDYATLMGYNIYRSDSKDGNYTKLNNVIIPSNENTFLDENAEPGKSYWYTFTVVLSDFTESAPAGKVFTTMLDTEKPNLYHTPVNQGYLNNNLVIYCTASDNVGITSVILYYRTKGETTWKQLTMLKRNDKYSATIFGSELSLDGLEYYIVASDGVNEITKGSAESPYTVLIKDSSALAMYGDVDGDSIITTKDALMIIKAINGDLILTDDQFKRADLNKDNTLSSVEALRILQYINGNVITLEM